MLHKGSFRAEKGVIRGRTGAIFGGVLWAKIASKSTARPKKISMLGLPPQTPLPNSEQLACPELHTGAHQRNLAFEMPGNRNGATDRGGRAAPYYGWKGEECLERLRKLQAVDEQLSNNTLADGMDCFKNKKAEPAERAFRQGPQVDVAALQPEGVLRGQGPPPHPTPPQQRRRRLRLGCSPLPCCLGRRGAHRGRPFFSWASERRSPSR